MSNDRVISPTETQPSTLPFPVIGIGASAGGLLAVRRLLAALPDRPGMAFVVVLHLSPKHESSADAVLAQVTRMPVTQVRGPVAIEANHVYVISPRSNLRMTDGILSLEEAQRPRGAHVAIDLFLRTLADAHGAKAVGIVLSGSGADGAVGLARVKEQGGVTIAQSPDEAEYESMPRAAIATGAVDFVLSSEAIAEKLVQLRDLARRISLPAADGEPVLDTRPDQRQETEHALRDVLELLLLRTGHDFRHYKRATVLRRIERRLQVNGLLDLPAYCDYLRAHTAETDALLDDMLISVTNFFRDREAFDALERDVIPELIGAAGAHPPRIWVPACASGEEAYSVGMLLSEACIERERPESFQVFASDIDLPAIATGRAGVYSGAIVTEVTQARLRRFFTREGERYRVAKMLRERILFAAHNVLRDPPFSRIDLICCRNLLIYLDRELQSRLLETFYFALRPGGLLFLGNSESAESNSDLFEPIDKKHRIYRARPGTRDVRYSHLVTSGVGPGLRGAPEHAPLPPTASPRGFSAAEVHRRVLEHYAAPSVIVDRDYQVVHLSDRAGRFLQHTGGEPSRHLLSLVLPELQRELRTALFQAVHSGKSVEACRVRLERDDGAAWVTMIARPFRDNDAGRDFLLVLFDEVEGTLAAVDDGAAGTARDEVILRMEQELERVRSRLQNTIEQSEVSNEELKASNEELQAINEELRSATEELETSKEELQSVNEELITVNAELSSKVEETAKVNDDLHNFMASVDVATVFVDSALRIKRYTPRAVDIFNIIASDVGRCLLDITHRLDYSDIAEDANAAFEHLRVIEREVRSVDGRSYAARVHPYRTGENRIDGAVLTFFDTTSLRAAERAAHDSADRLRHAVSHSRDHAIVVCDDAGIITAWNAGAESIFEWSAAEAVGQSMDIIFLPEDLAAGVPARERDAARQYTTVSEDRRHRRRSGEAVACTGSLTFFASGEHDGFVKIVRDASQLADQNERTPPGARAEGDPGTALKDDFIAVISHELKNPLNLIAMNTEIIAREPDVRGAENAMQAVAAIRGAIRGQGKIIDDLLDMSRIRTGKFEIAPVPLDLNGVLESLLEFVTADAAANGVTFEFVPERKPAVVNADPQRIEQVFWNLLSNAVKFTPPGGSVRVVIENEREMVKVSIADTGAGIDPHFLPRVWDLFSQAPGRARGGRVGLGIGLNLVRQLVNRHGGDVRAESEGPGRGATFSVWVPRFVAPPPVLREPAPQDASPRLPGVRLLIAEDAADAANALRLLLQFEGAEVRVAHDGQAALEMLGQAPIDLIVSDIGMPGMNGLELARAVRNSETFRALPMIALTGLGRNQDVQDTLDAGFDAHVDKPVILDALVEQVRRLLALS